VEPELWETEQGRYPEVDEGLVGRHNCGKTEGKAKPGLLRGTLVQLDFKADPLAAKRGLVKALSRG